MIYNEFYKVIWNANEIFWIELSHLSKSESFLLRGQIRIKPLRKFPLTIYSLLTLSMSCEHMMIQLNLFPIFPRHFASNHLS